MTDPFYKPTMIGVADNVLRNAVDCLKIGMESTQELLAIHDTNLGRTTKKNKALAEIYEAEIAKTKNVIGILGSQMSN